MSGLLTPSEQRGIDRLVAEGVLSRLPKCPFCACQVTVSEWKNHLKLFCPKRPAAEKEAK